METTSDPRVEELTSSFKKVQLVAQAESRAIAVRPGDTKRQIATMILSHDDKEASETDSSMPSEETESLPPPSEPVQPVAGGEEEPSRARVADEGIETVFLDETVETVERVECQ